MAKLIDYHCRYADYSGMSKDDAAAKGLSLPEAYCIAEQIALLAGPQAVLPFDPIVEAEAMGADAVINVRYASSAIMQGAAEVIAYGTAVKIL